MDLRLGSDWFMREVVAGCNYKSQNDLNLHFGLDTATVIDEMVANWPDGSTRTLTNYPANRKFKIYPTSKLGDMNQDGNFDLSDIPDFVGCVNGPSVASIPVDCELADINGNGSVDLDDNAALAVKFGP